MQDRPPSMTPKRILMVAPEPVFEPRGTPFSVVYRIRALCRAGHQVDLITYPYGRDVHIDGLRIIRVPRLPGVAGVRIGPSPAKIVLDLLLIVWTVRMLASRRYDCIWSHEEAGLFCGLASRITGIKHIYDMHSDLSQQIRNYKRFNRGPFVWVFSLMTRAMVHWADVVLTICDDLVDTIRSIAPTKRVLLVENYCTTVDFLDDPVPAVDELRTRHHVEGQLVALYIGSLEPYQGIDILIDAADYLKRHNTPCRLIIVGGSANQADELRAEVSRRKLEHRIEVVGSVPPASVDSYVQLADILLTSRSMGTNVPLKIYSYMKSGKPIVATKIESHTQLLDDQTAILVDVDGESFGAGIARLADDPTLRETLANRALANAGTFTEGTFEQQIDQAMRWVCESEVKGNPCAASRA